MDIPFWQTGAFWGGVALTAIVGLITSVSANIFHSRIVAFLDSRKVTSHKKRRTKALSLHRIIADIHNGRRDRHAYMLRMTAGIVTAFTLSIVFLSSALVIFALTPPLKEINEAQVKPMLALLTLFGMSLFGLFILTLTTRRFREITNALENYDEYLTRFKAQWGEVD